MGSIPGEVIARRGVPVGRTVRGSVPQVLRTAHLYLGHRAESLTTDAAKKREADELKKYIAVHGEETPEGHLDWVFDQPVTVAGTTYTGLRNQRSNPAPLLDEEDAEALLTELGLRDEVIQTVEVEVADWDKLYVLHQQGKITEEQLDSLFHTPEPSWSLVVIK